MGAEPQDGETRTAPRAVSSLNAQLMAHGYAKRPLKLDRLSDAEQVHVANVITELLGASVANLFNLEELGGRYRSLEYEHGRLFKLSEKYEREAGRLECDVAAQRARADAAEKRLAEEEDKVKALRDDVARGRKALDGLKVAAGHETKRAQLKLDKLRDQLARAAPIPPSFELLNPIPRGATAPAPPGPLPLLEASLRDLADIRESLQEEAEAFRHVVVSTANGLREAVAAAQGRESPRLLVPGEFFAVVDDDAQQQQHRRGVRGGGVRQVSSWTAHPAIADAKLRALVADARALLTQGVSPLMRDGSGTTEAEADEAAELARAARERARAEADLRDRVKDLEVELAIVRGREDEANKVVEELSRLNVHGSVPSTTDFEHARLRDELVRQKRLLDAERDQLRDEATRLHELRLAVEAEQVAAEAAKAAADEAKAQAEAAAQTVSDTTTDAPEPPPASSSGHSHQSSRPHEPSQSSQAAEQSSAPPPRAALTPRKHVTSAPSPLSPHHGGAPRKLVASTNSPKPKVHVAKRSRKSLARAVLDRQHRRSVEGGVNAPPGVPRRRTASGGSSMGAASSEGGSSAGPPQRARTPSASRRLMAGTASSLARSTAKPEPAGRPRTAAWK